MIIITMIIVILMVIGGSSGKYLLGGVGVGAVGMFGILNLFSHSKGRLDVWKNPFDYLREGGWQPAQSLYAIGNGGIWGVGIGQSMQKHLYLPEPMNDYIFAILCEEFGFIGAVCIILLFVFFVYRGIIIAFRAPDRFSSLVVLGITAQVGLQALLNMMVVTNTIPSTGISLPFFSYGGSALTILLAEMGVILSISRYSVIEKK
jgi:cell division protein FtsW